MSSKVMSPCLHCEEQSSDCWKGRKPCGKDILECEHCTFRFEWRVLEIKEPENILEESQFHPWGSTTARETYVIGFRCPECGHVNKF